MIRRLRLMLSDWLLSSALKVLPKNSSEQLLLALSLKKYLKLLAESKKSFPNE